MFVFILVLIWREGAIMREHLRGEVQAGTLTQPQYDAVCSLAGQFIARWSALAGGQFLQAGKFYDKCGELAFRKYQFARVGAERDTHGAIDGLRSELATLGREI